MAIYLYIGRGINSTAELTFYGVLPAAEEFNVRRTSRRRFLEFSLLGKNFLARTAMNISKEALCSLSLYLRIYAVHVTFGRIIYLFPNIIYLFLHYIYIYIELLLNREIIKFLTS